VVPFRLSQMYKKSLVKQRSFRCIRFARGSDLNLDDAALVGRH
jgi:hypothetical protein